MSQQNLPTPPEQQPTPQPEPTPSAQPPQSPVQSSGSQNQAQVPTPPTGTENNASLATVITAITTAVSPSQLHQQLKTFAPREVRDVILASLLPDGQDPLSVLDIQANTLGILHILCVIQSFLGRLLDENARVEQGGADAHNGCAKCPAGVHSRILPHVCAGAGTVCARSRYGCHLSLYIVSHRVFSHAACEWHTRAGGGSGKRKPCLARSEHAVSDVDLDSCRSPFNPCLIY